MSHDPLNQCSTKFSPEKTANCTKVIQTIILFVWGEGEGEECEVNEACKVIKFETYSVKKKKKVQYPLPQQILLGTCQ